MERILSVDEKIRRAEEIYNRRRQDSQYQVQARVSVGERGNDYRLFKKMVIQIIVCLIIYFVFYTIKNSNYIFSEEFIKQTKQVLSYDLNIQEQYNNIMGLVNKPQEQQSITQDQPNQTQEENTITNENIYTNIINNNTEEVSNHQENTLIDTLSVTDNALPEESSSLSQTLTDADIIKQKYSLIKPLTGVITSRFGPRNPTTPTVPKYHTGIDIAANTGTVIISAMEGKVVLVSSQGDYGNHIKIQKDDVITLYAHCSKIYVSEGQEIKQGEQIAEVGATGNVTGPHLHFEVRKGANLVNPDDLLEF